MGRDSPHEGEKFVEFLGTLQYPPRRIVIFHNTFGDVAQRFCRLARRSHPTRRIQLRETSAVWRRELRPPVVLSRCFSAAPCAVWTSPTATKPSLPAWDWAPVSTKFLSSTASRSISARKAATSTGVCGGSDPDRGTTPAAMPHSLPHFATGGGDFAPPRSQKRLILSNIK